MKRMMLVAALLTGVAGAQIPLKPGGSIFPLIKPALKNVFPAGYDAAEACTTGISLASDGDLHITYPARFPEPERKDWFTGSYRLNCPTYTVERRVGDTLTITGLSIEELLSRLERDSDDLGYLWLTDDTYLNLQEPGTLTPMLPDDPDIDPSYVVAARQPGQPLQPVIFNGAVAAITYDPSKPLEIFRKYRYGIPWERAVWIADAKILHFDVESPMPTR